VNGKITTEKLQRFGLGLFKPDLYLDSILQLEVPEGIEHLILDLDGVLTPKGRLKLIPEIVSKVSYLSNILDVVILTNRTSHYFNSQRLRFIRKIEMLYGVPVVPSRIPKPLKGAFELACEVLGARDTASVAMVGDSIIADVMGARLAGLGFVVKVKSLSNNGVIYEPIAVPTDAYSCSRE